MRTHPLVAGLAVGLPAGVIARRWWERKSSRGPRGALSEGLPGGVDGIEQALLQATGTEFTRGNRVTWHHDGSVFDALVQRIGEARHSIHVDIYIWKSGRVGRRVCEAVVAAARRGVAVRILVDPVGSPGFEDDFEARLRAAGCEVKYFRPLRKHPLSITGRNHRKLVVVDGAVAFTGGFGFGDEWSGDGRSEGHWRDEGVEAEGPVVRQLQLAFAAHWLETGGSLLPAEEFSRARPAGEARACFVTSMDVKGLSSARWVTQIAIAAAHRSLWIANAYFAPPPRIFGALCNRHQAGVDVRLMLPGPYQDHPTVTFLQRRFYPRLASGGVKVYEYQPSMLHSKTMLVDERLVVVGSINLDLLSQEFLEEGSLVVDDRPFAAELARCWREDLERSKQVTRDEASGACEAEPASATH